MRILALVASLSLVVTPALAAGSALGGTVTLPSVSAGTPATALCKDSSNNIVTNGVSSNCFAGGGGGDVIAAGNNAFTGNNTFSTGTFTHNVDPLIHGGSNGTDGAIFFGTNFGHKFFGYDATTGGTGGYSLGDTFGSSDTLYTGPVHIKTGSATADVTLSAPGSGSWTMTLPTSGGTSGYLLSTNGSGVTSWIAPAAGTSGANPTATASDTAVNGVATTFMRSDAAPAIQKGSSSVFGLVKVDGTSITASGGTISANGFVTAGGNNAFTGNNSFSTGTTTFNVDPTVHGNGNATDGAIFFGTNLGTRYIGYDATTGGTGGYSLGSTYGVADTLYTGPVHIKNGGSADVTVNAGSSGNWNLTLPTSGGTSGYLLQTNGSGLTSWVAPAAGTVSSVTCGANMTGGTITTTGTCNATATISGVTAGTNMTGGGSSGSVTLNVPTATTGITGATLLASSACSGSTNTAVTPASMAATTSGTNIAGCMGTLKVASGQGTSDGSGNFSITMATTFSNCYGYSGGATGLTIVVFSSCSGSTISGRTLTSSTGLAAASTAFGYVAVGN